MNKEILQIEDCDPLQPCATCDLFEECQKCDLMNACCELGEGKRYCKPIN